MISAIAMAFNYKNSDSFLPGIIVDIYLFYKYCKQLNIRNIIVITDLEIDEIRISSHINAIYKGFVGSDIIQFIDDIRTNNVIRKFEHFNFVDQFKKIINDFNKDTNRLIIYYSGHGVEQGPEISLGPWQMPGPLESRSFSYFVFPDKSIMKIVDLQNILLNSNFTDIFFIVDCCHLTDIDFLLPYKFISGPGLCPSPFSSENKWRCISADNVPNKNMLIITSTDVFNVSITSNNGSVFTRWILKILTELLDYGPDRNYSRSLDSFYTKLSELYKKQTEDNFNSAMRKYAISLNFQILSSFPDVTSLPYWLFPYNSGRICYEIIPKHNYLILKNHPI